MTRLIAAAEQDDYLATADQIVDTVTLSYVDSEFAYPAANRAVVTKVAIFDTLNAGQDGGFGLQVTQSSEPLREESGRSDFHTPTVSYKRHGVKLEKRDFTQKLGRLVGNGCVLRAGAALFPFASARGFPRFAEDWGTLTTDLLARKGVAVKKDAELNFAVRFVVHDGDEEAADVAGLWRAFDAAGAG